MKASIKNLIASNPSGLLELKPALTIDEYRDNYGFGLEKTFTIYESKRSHHSRKDWFAFSNTLETLFKVQEESNGDLLVTYIVETMKDGHIYCNLILTDQAFKELRETQHVLKVYQMFTQFWEDHIALNLKKAS